MSTKRPSSATESPSPAADHRSVEGDLRRDGRRSNVGRPVSVFGDFVRLRREELNLDQTALARRLGVNQQTVSKWEQAKSVPRPDRIRRLAEVLRVDATELLRYAGYLPDDEPVDAQVKEPFHQLMEQVARLTNDQLILLIDQAWEEYRNRAGFSVDGPRRRRGDKAGG